MTLMKPSGGAKSNQGRWSDAKNTTMETNLLMPNLFYDTIILGMLMSKAKQGTWERRYSFTCFTKQKIVSLVSTIIIATKYLNRSEQIYYYFLCLESWFISFIFQTYFIIQKMKSYVFTFHIKERGARNLKK